MKRLHVVGRKNNGKTTLITDLVHAMTDRGLQVGAIKHTGHAHELDRAGSDSHKLRSAGASPSAIAAGPLVAAFLPLAEDDDYVDVLAPLYERCDIVLVESNLSRPGTKIEVWRREAGTEVLAQSRDDVAAVVSDDAPDVPVPVWPRSDVAGLVDRVLGLLEVETPERTTS